MQEAWLTFFSATDIDSITALVRAFPMFLPIYQEITDFAQNPKEMMNMFSEALYIMDRNMERQMVEEMRREMPQRIQEEAKREAKRIVQQELEQRVQQEVEQRVQKEANAIADAAKTEANIFRLRLLGKSTEEIAEKLAIPLDKVGEVLATLTAP